LLDIYWLADGLVAPDHVIEIGLPRGPLVRRVRLGPCLPFASVRHDDEMPDELRRKRGVVHAVCRQRAAMPVDKTVEAARADVLPLLELVSFAQRRAVWLSDAVVVTTEGLLRLHEPRQTALSPKRGYGLLVHVGSLQPFLRSAICRLRGMARPDQESCRDALAFHRAACAQRALIRPRLVEHLGALDIFGALLVGHPSRQVSQLDHWKHLRQHLLSARWPASVLPRPVSLRFLRDVRDDLAHARLSKVLKPGSRERNRRAILRATEICVTLLEACALGVLGLGPSGPRLLVNLPFRFKGWVQRVWIGQQ
jgi:hypothetical protein